ncbi:adenylate/guanylate cyclase domain-containing protein [Oceanibacterium hippocampi]|uniref:Adenylate cyclase 1 n=1 Tax=Oceanibacterium hippocampi TaxID=745714 RepID=A0A1Y5TQP2_9PROT|nr:adenylate/guanylate cyclase domain-containing protein [Oceanibacterium hippocampi]SLN69294.1 Adenylate cyclase 1 [Oceanibacterium hippocampi]
MDDGLRAWLQDLGLAKYADIFADNDVGLDVLGYLTEDHLRELGVSLGNRLRLLKAIAAETGLQVPATPINVPEPTDPWASAQTPTVFAPTGTAPERPAPATTTDAERRPLTVMFCDLADSTALSTKLDPEDLQDVIRAYQETSTRLVRKYDGYVAKYMGDGILVYFGYPKSLERDAERAVRSALAIVEAMAGLNQTLGRDKDIAIAVRIGIATGVVMVGEVVGDGMAQERTVIGEAPNMAARLQGVAGRNGIVIGSLTKELSGDAFIYDDTGARELKGIPGLVKTWGVLGLRDDAARDAEHEDPDGAADLPPLVGREEESGLLRRAWQSVQEEGRGQAVTISGEAGIGKSVLVDGLRAEIRAEGLPQIVLRCSPYHVNSAFFPVIEYFKRLAGWQPEDDTGARLGKLEVALQDFEQPTSETVPLLAALLSLPLPEDRYPPLALTPQQQKQRIQDLVIAMILEEAERRPIMQIWEDLHWADPSTLELIGVQIDQVPTASLLMLLTARPDFIPPWPARSHITPITLNRLEAQHAAALITNTAGRNTLPEDVIDHIVTKADGVPLYVEELTKTILASDILRDIGDRLVLTGPLSSLSIPDTLQESLMARLDRLPQVRELAQLGSVLGREFAYEMISGLSATSDSVLQDGLQQLVDAELLYRRGRPPRARYIFKHALVQDAAYGSLLRRTREQCHLQVAQLMEASFPEIVEMSPQLVAHHYLEAGKGENAVDYFQRASARAIRMSAHSEAIAHLSKGLELVETLPEGSARDRLELSMQMSMGQVLIAAEGYAAVRAETAYLRALALCREMADVEKEFSIVQGLSVIYFVRADLKRSRELAEYLVKLAGSRKVPGPDLAADRSLGYALTFLGELEAGHACLDRASSSYDSAIHRAFAAGLGGADMGVGSYCFNAWCLFALGFPDRARESTTRGLKLAQELNHPLSEAFVHCASAVICLMRGEHEMARRHATSGVDMATEKGFPQYIHFNRIPLHRVLLDLEEGEAVENITRIRVTIDACRAVGSNLVNPLWLSMLAPAYGQDGQTADGLAIVADALGEITRTSERIWEAELLRIKGQLLLNGGNANVSESETCFRKAIAVAQAQNARGWELRAATNLARLWLDQGKPDDARDLLRPIYDWFTEGFETADLKCAQSLLDELG